MFRFLFLLILPIALLGCERIPLDEYALPEYDGQLTWTQLSKKAEWPKRLDHAAVAYHESLWIFGGYNPGAVKGDTYYEDIWKSADGINWELVSNDAPWMGRRGHRVLVFNDGSGEALFLIGGFSANETTGYRQYNNDVWKSEDGINWTEIKARTYPKLSDTADWMPRMHHACLAVNHGGTNYIYLIGGRTQLENHNSRYASVYFNDVWRSTDGILWDKLDNNDYGIRSEHAAIADPSTGRLYIQGGTHGILFDTENKISHPLPDWQDLWYSDNGVEWHPTSDSSKVEDKYLFRSGHQFVFYEDKIWSLPGKTVSNVHYHFTYEEHYSAWTFEEDNFWEIDSKGTVIDPRHSYAAVVFENKIWVFGGFTDNKAQSNDVWTAQY